MNHTIIQPNVDLNEIAKFNALAQDWWDPHGSAKPLHAINPLRLKFITDQINLSGKKIVDVGCGGGILAESMAKLGANVTGIDLGEEVLAVARHHAEIQQLNIHYEHVAAEEMAAQQSDAFDVVTCMELLEHVPDPAAIILDCARLVKPGGQLFFSTINRNPKAYLFAILGAEYILKLLPAGTHDYTKFIRPAEFSNWARTAGLEVREFMGMTYRPFTKQYQLTTNIDVNYLVGCVRD